MNTILSRPVLLFGGKGGVGKTTCSSAVAAHLAGKGLRTLLVTTDLTPSLSDIFGRPIGDRVAELAGGLFALEVGPATVVARWKSEFGPDFAEILAHFIDMEALDAGTRHHLLDYIGTAPSLLEETMLDLVAETAEDGGYHRVIWDTAPAGETLGLLDMPRAIRRHLSAGARFYEELDRIGHRISGRRSIARIMDGWVERSEELSRFLLNRAAVVLVSIPEALVVAQTERIFATLREYRMEVAGLIVNRAEHSASFAPHLVRLEELGAGLPIACLPSVTGGVLGLESLRKAGAVLAEGLGL